MDIPNIRTLPSVALEDRSELPNTPCIYFAIDSNNVVQYIGQTANANKRWKSNGHHKYEKLSQLLSVRIAYLETDIDLLNDIEKALIEYFDPPLNGRKGVNFGRPASSQEQRLRTKTIQSYVDKDFYEQVKVIAQYNNCSVSNLVVQLLDKKIKEHNRTLMKAQQFKEV